MNKKISDDWLTTLEEIKKQYQQYVEISCLYTLPIQQVEETIQYRPPSLEHPLTTNEIRIEQNEVNVLAHGCMGDSHSQRASSVHSTQREAEQRAKEIVRNSSGGEVRIQGRDGRWRDSDTVPPGNDPYPPRDTR